jgi:hypothetical protein
MIKKEGVRNSPTSGKKNPYLFFDSSSDLRETGLGSDRDEGRTQGGTSEAK